MCKVETLDFFGIGETNSPYYSWMVDTEVTDIPVGLAFRGVFKKDIIILDTWQ